MRAYVVAEATRRPTVRTALVLLSLSGCIALPTPAQEDAGTPDAARDATLTSDAHVFADAFVPRDARVPIEAGPPRDAASDGALTDARVDAQTDAGTDAEAPRARVLVTEVRTRGPSGANDELVEIVNAGDAPLDVGGYRLRAAGASGAVGTRAIVPAGVVLPPGGCLLFANGSASGYSGAVVPDVTYTFGLADESGVAIADASGAVLDAFGTLAASTLYEGTPRAPMTDNLDRSHARRRDAQGDLVDDDDNAHDFEDSAPSTPCSAAGAAP